MHFIQADSCFQDKKPTTERLRLTEHGLQANQAADEAVEVDVHVLVGIAHRNDVIQLVVEAKA